MVYQLPDQYHAVARVHVDTKSMLDPLLRGLTMGTNSGQQVQLVTRTLLSRPNLEKLMRMTDLDLVALTPSDKEEILDDLASDITNIKYPRAGPVYHHVCKQRPAAIQACGAVIADDICREHPGPESRRDRQLPRHSWKQQIKEYEAKLEAAELRLAEFKRTARRHDAGLGGGLLRAAAGGVQLAEAGATCHCVRHAIERTNSSSKWRTMRIHISLYNEVMPEAGSALDMRIQALNERRDELLLKYTEKHPDVLEIEQLIAELEQKREAERELLDELDVGPVR